MKRLVSFLLLLTTISASAQIFDRNNRNNRNNNRNDRWNRNADFLENRRRAPSLSMGIQVIDPLGEFGREYGGTPVGLSGIFMVNAGRSPFEFGFGASWAGMGSSSEDVFITIGQDVNGFDLFSEGRMTVRSNIYTYHTMGRFKPLAGPVQPYVDLMAGVKNFSSKSKIEEDGSSNVLSEGRVKRDFALSTGWAMGVKVRINPYMMIEGRFEKLEGGEVDFIDPGSLVIGFEGELDYKEVSTKTNSNVFHIGISVEF